jgi:hypothetical protein
MDMQKTPVLAKSGPSGGNYSESQEKSFNAVTMAALQETSDIMSGQKKVKWNRFQPEETKTGAREKLKEILGS